MTTDPNNISTYTHEFQIGPATPTPAHDGDVTRALAEWAAPLIGQGADTTTTIIGLKRGFEEANPVAAMVTGNPVGFIAVKLGMAIAQHFIVKGLYDSGHEGWAKLFGAASFASGAIPAALNIRTIERGKP